MDYSLPGSSVHGIFQEWVVIPFSKGEPGIEPRFPAPQEDSLLSDPLYMPI